MSVGIRLKHPEMLSIVATKAVSGSDPNKPRLILHNGRNKRLG